MRPISWLVLGAAILSATGCAVDRSDADSVVSDAAVPPDGCYSFTSLPDSAYGIASDIDWPTQVRWRDRRGEPEYGYSFSADALDDDWGSLASPLGRGQLNPPDSITLTWGGESYRLRVAEDGTLSGVAVLSSGGDIPDEVVGEVVGNRVACGE